MLGFQPNSHSSFDIAQVDWSFPISYFSDIQHALGFEIILNNLFQSSNQFSMEEKTNFEEEKNNFEEEKTNFEEDRK